MPPGYIDGLAVSFTNTLTSPFIYTPTIASGTWNQPIITQGTLTAPTIDRLTDTIVGGRVFKTAAVGTAKTLDLATADIYLVQLTCGTTLTVSNAATGKAYQMIVQQDIANSYTALTYMSGFINGFVDSGVTQSTGAIDYWTIIFDGSKHFAVGVKDIQ